MLQRTLARSLVPAVARNGCAVCTCRCGALLPAPSTLVPSQSVQQRRAKSGPRPAPSTFRQARETKRSTLDYEQARERREGMALSKSHVYRGLQAQFTGGLVTFTPDVGVAFCNSFAALAVPARGMHSVEYQKRFLQMAEEAGLSQGDITRLVYVLLRSYVDDNRELGKKMLLTLSSVGNQEATVRILSHALLDTQARTKRSKLEGNLKSSEVLYARGRLREIAREGVNYRAMVLEGKIAYELGDDGYAIQMWEQAMGAAVEASEFEARTVAADKSDGIESGRLRELRYQRGHDLAELSTPWIELTMIHYERYAHYWQRNEIGLALAEIEKARKANQIGCEQDDPTSHYHAAEFFKEVNADGSMLHTSSWLYHMTKAGATGHVMAAYKLAEYYAYSGWKFIEDEPPDHVKPTAFDSYPAPEQDGKDKKGLFNVVRRTLGLETAAEKAEVQKPPLSGKDAMFHLATFPATPSDRLLLAVRWLEFAVSYFYAPAFLLAAKIHLEKDLWGQAYAPASALQLMPQRYTYASKEDFEAGRPIERAEGEKEVVRPDEPSLGYDPVEAKHFLIHIFYAAQAIRFRTHYLAKFERVIARKQVKGESAEFWIGEAQIPDTVASPVRAFLKYTNVREMWESDVDEMEAEAMEICEREGWDMWDEKGGLVYRHGLGGKSMDGLEEIRYVVGKEGEKDGIWKT
ncbi:hypothetical protein LTR08_008037 [Meristemomyces frigidus]|nr:hypothetical protein LTR08_008037 [Meristemomyces frigidus]